MRMQDRPVPGTVYKGPFLLPGPPTPLQAAFPANILDGWIVILDDLGEDFREYIHISDTTN
jgi:hypothetical protein